MTNNAAIERALESGDPEALLARGLAELSRAASIEAANRAAQLIEAASAAGHAPASERLALIECMGVGRPINWTRALDYLGQAAAQGSQSAGRQLQLLAGREAKLAMPASPGAPYWSKLRARIELKALLGPKPGLAASERPSIRVFPGFAAPGECRWLVETARDRLGPSTVYDYSTGALRPDSRRTCSAAFFTFGEVDLVTEMIRARIAATLGLQLPQFEASQVLNYAPQQEFKPHHDYFDPSAVGFHEEIAKHGQRIATFLIYLNDEFEGGKTQFPSLGFSYRGEIGDAITFANLGPEGTPEPLTLHAGLPPTSGEKWIFSQWVRDRAPHG